MIRKLDILFVISLLFQLIVISYIVFIMKDPILPTHFNFKGEADDYGSSSFYYLLIGINLIIYLALVLTARRASIKLDDFTGFNKLKNDQERLQFEQKIRHKMSLLFRVVAISFSFLLTIDIAIMWLCLLLGVELKGDIMLTSLLCYLLILGVIFGYGIYWLNKDNSI